jgi:hypothetical protein
MPSPTGRDRKFQEAEMPCTYTFSIRKRPVRNPNLLEQTEAQVAGRVQQSV